MELKAEEVTEVLSYEAIVGHINDLAKDTVSENKSIAYDNSLVCTRVSVLTLTPGVSLSVGDNGYYFLGKNGRVYYTDKKPNNTDHTIVLTHVYPLEFIADRMSNSFKKTRRHGEPVIPKLTYADLEEVRDELKKLIATS